LYLRLVQKFGESAVFIDRKLTPSVDWQARIQGEIDRCTAFVLIIGNRFVERLKRQESQTAERAPGAAGHTDELVFEVARALSGGKRIYPVVAGLADMPSESQLPEAIRPVRRIQAIFAPAQYFDTAMDGLVEGIAAAHNWVETSAPKPLEPRTLAAQLAALAALMAVLILAAGLIVVLGRGVLLLGMTASVSDGQLDVVFWQGWRYLVVTLVGGLGPYVVYWAVAEVRTRAHLPAFNFQGLLATVNLTVMLLTGSTFLLLSTLNGWAVRPFMLSGWIGNGFATHFLLTFVWIVIAVSSVMLSLWEVRARGFDGPVRAARLRSINVLGCLQLAAALWYLASLLTSLAGPPQGSGDRIIGYLLLTPMLSLLMVLWQTIKAHLGVRQRSWPFLALIGLLFGVYLTGSVSLYANGLLPLLEFNDRSVAVGKHE
jgi:hypothetical protein